MHQITTPDLTLENSAVTVQQCTNSREGEEEEREGEAGEEEEEEEEEEKDAHGSVQFGCLFTRPGGNRV